MREYALIVILAYLIKCFGESVNPTNPLPGWYISTYDTGDKVHAICPRGSYCQNSMRYPCPAGRYGAIEGEINSTCSGPCARGWYCPAGSLSKIQIPCGGHHQYCPEGSGAPIPVSIGHYTIFVTDNHNPEENTLFLDEVVMNSETILLRENASIAPYEKMYTYNSMHSGAQVLCEPGYYCLSDGIRRRCPAGRYGNTTGLSTAGCAGVCPEGYYCPAGTADPATHRCGNSSVFCPQGSSEPQRVQIGWFSAGGLSPDTATMERKCYPGTYCASDGIKRLCDPGRYGDTFGLSTAACSGPCEPGYYCPEGSSSGREIMCGDPSFYCPPLTHYPFGNHRPVPVSEGYYTVGGGERWESFSAGANVAARVGQRLTEPGYYSMKGLKYLCPAGRYGRSYGLSSALCSGYCHVPGYYCPAGSVSPYMKACGHSNVYCPAGTAEPIRVRVGYYTSDPSLELCPPGQYRNWTGQGIDLSLSSSSSSSYRPALLPTAIAIPSCELCPEGTYKQVSGDSAALCLPCNTNHTQSSPDRISCQCTVVWTPADPDTQHNADPFVGVYDYNTAQCTPVPVAAAIALDESFVEPNSALTRYEEFECEPGYYCVDGLRYPCAAGFYGSTARSHGNASCDGPCAPGHYCPLASTSPRAIQCGSVAVYCPEGSASPLTVAPGHYSNEDTAENIRSAQFPCDPGHYCEGARRFPCEAGTYAAGYGNASPQCEGLCDPGYYCDPGSVSPRQHVCGSSAFICPRGSQRPVPVLNGFYGIHTGDDAHARALWDEHNTTRSAQIPCEPGYYCVDGNKYPCPPGTYGWRHGLNSSECSGKCAAGYYCPSYMLPPPEPPAHAIWPMKPHTSAAEYECGGSQWFCPRGSFYPQRVGGGNYTTGGGANNRTRTGQAVCDPGNYCVDGIIQPCPKGKYGITPGLAVISCSGWCPAAHQCPLGTAVPIRCPEQTYSVGAGWSCAPCPGNNTFALPCHDSRYCCFQGG